MRFSTGMMMAAGLLIALTTGLCSLAATASIIQWALSADAGRPSWELLVFLIFPAMCFGLTALGIVLFRRSRELAKIERDARD